MLRISQTTLTLIIQLSHNQLDLVQEELLSMLRKIKNTTITITLRILEILVSMRLSTDLLLTIRVFSHNHGEELRKLTHKMDS